jgi:glucose/arabinose dehydrogenase
VRPFGARAAALAAAGTLAALLAGGATAAGPGAPQLQPLLSGLDQPTYVTTAPGEPKRLYVVEQTGRIRIAEAGKLRAEPFLDLSAAISTGGERGLLSVAFAPDYATSRRLYVDFTDRSGNTAVVEYRSDGTRALPASARRLLSVAQPYANHNGGQLQFGRNGLLYVGMGDGGSGGDPENRAQDLSSRLGKLLAIDTRTGKVAVAAIGLRNPWRFSFDRATGDLWIGDVGQDTWEEVDHVATAALPVNFGWSVFEGRVRFKDGQLTPGFAPVGPVAVYSHAQGCSVTGGYVYRGRRVPALTGRYVYGDFCSGRIWSLSATATARSRGVAPRLEPWTVTQLVSFGEDATGELLIVSHGGTVSRLVP